MTKKDYTKFAAKLNGLKPVQSDLESLDEYMARREEWKIIVWGIDEVLGSDNPRYDSNRFLVACGLTS